MANYDSTVNDTKGRRKSKFRNLNICHFDILIQLGNCYFTASYDPGWNDPPKLTYNPQQTTPNRPRNFLNKRVAFPLSGGTSTPGQTPPVNLPPLPASAAPPVQNMIITNPKEDIDIDSDSALEEVKDILISFLDSSQELGSKAASIKKRIENMENMWTSGKLNKQVQIQMKDLAYGKNFVMVGLLVIFLV